MISHLLPLLFLIQAPQGSGPAQLRAQPPAQPAQTPQRVIASSNEWSITTEQYDAILKTFPEQDRLRYVDPEYRRGLVNELVRIWALCTEARKQGIDIGNDYASQRAYYQKYAAEVATTISDPDVRGYYDAHIDDFTILGFSHILILNGDSPITPDPDAKRLPYKEAEKKAKEIKAMLDSGADWDKVAKEYSQDQSGTASRVAKGQIEKSLENALFSMKVGEISDVVGSVFGFHILHLTDKQVIAFEEFREPIHQKLITDEVNRRLDVKVKEAAVMIDESFFE